MATTSDSHLAKMGAPQGTASAVDPADTALPEPFAPLPVRNESPALVITSVTSLSANNPTRLILPQDPRRRSALVLAVDNPVYLASSLEVAQAAEGSSTSTLAFYLPVGVPIPVASKGAVWAAATTTSDTLTGAPALPSSTKYVQSPFAFETQVVIAAGTVTAVSVNGIQVGSADGTYYVPAYGAITLTYSGSPTWTWTALSTVTSRVSVLVEKDDDLWPGRRR
jgi:hypothetical protein